MQTDGNLNQPFIEHITRFVSSSCSTIIEIFSEYRVAVQYMDGKANNSGEETSGLTHNSSAFLIPIAPHNRKFNLMLMSEMGSISIDIPQ